MSKLSDVPVPEIPDLAVKLKVDNLSGKVRVDEENLLRALLQLRTYVKGSTDYVNVALRAEIESQFSNVRDEVALGIQEAVADMVQEQSIKFAEQEERLSKVEDTALALQSTTERLDRSSSKATTDRSRSPSKAATSNQPQEEDSRRRPTREASKGFTAESGLRFPGSDTGAPPEKSRSSLPAVILHPGEEGDLQTESPNPKRQSRHAHTVELGQLQSTSLASVDADKETHTLEMLREEARKKIVARRSERKMSSRSAAVGTEQDRSRETRSAKQKPRRATIVSEAVEVVEIEAAEREEAAEGPEVTRTRSRSEGVEMSKTRSESEVVRSRSGTVF